MTRPSATSRLVCVGANTPSPKRMVNGPSRPSHTYSVDPELTIQRCILPLSGVQQHDRPLPDCAIRYPHSTGRDRSMDLEFRTINEDEFDEFIRAVERGFGGHATPEELAVERSVAEITRNMVAIDRGRFVGTTGAYTFDLTVPGGVAPMAGVTSVAVNQTH